MGENLPSAPPHTAPDLLTTTAKRSSPWILLRIGGRLAGTGQTYCYAQFLWWGTCGWFRFSGRFVFKVYLAAEDRYLYPARHSYDEHNQNRRHARKPNHQRSAFPLGQEKFYEIFHTILLSGLSQSRIRYIWTATSWRLRYIPSAGPWRTKGLPPSLWFGQECPSRPNSNHDAPCNVCLE